MEYIYKFSILVFIVFSSCNKENRKGCWRGYDGILNETGVFCDKTKAEAKALPNNAFVCPADEKKYCWIDQNSNHYPCVPQTIIEDWGGPQGKSFTKETCTGTCLIKKNIETGIASLFNMKSLENIKTNL